MTTRVSNSLFMGVLQPRGLEGVGWYARVLSERDWASQVALVERFVGLGFTRAVNDIGGGKIVLDADDRLFTDPLPAGESVRVQDQEAIWQILENGVIRGEFLAEDLREDVIHPESGLRTTEISGRGIGAVLDWAKVLPVGLPVPASTQRTFTGRAALDVWLQLLQEAQAEGYLSFVTATFDAASDSAGNPWAEVVDLTVNAGDSLLDLLTRWCEAYGLTWKMNTGFLLEVRPEAAARHLEGTIVFTAHRDQNEHSRMVSRREIANVVYTETSVPAAVEGEPDGLVVAVATDLVSQARWRKRALWLSAGDSAGPSSASAVANATLGLTKDEKQSRTIQINPTVPGRLPFEDFDVNDWVAVELEKGATDSIARRVMAMTVDIDAEGYPAVELTLQSRFENRQIKLQKALDKMGAGSSSAASSTPIPASGTIATTKLADLNDIDVTGAVSGRVLTYRDGKWVDEDVPAPQLGLNALTDVDTATAAPTPGQALVWDDAAARWVPGSVASGGGGGGGGSSVDVVFAAGDFAGTDTGGNYAGATTNLTVRQAMKLTGLDCYVTAATTYTLKINGATVATATTNGAGMVTFGFDEFVLNPGQHTIGITGTGKVRYRNATASIVYTGVGYDFTASGWNELSGNYTIPFVYKGLTTVTQGPQDIIWRTSRLDAATNTYAANVWLGVGFYAAATVKVKQVKMKLNATAGVEYKLQLVRLTGESRVVAEVLQSALVTASATGAVMVDWPALSWQLGAGNRYALMARRTDATNISLLYVAANMSQPSAYAYSYSTAIDAMMIGSEPIVGATMSNCGFVPAFDITLGV